jgi:hypothetical protein
VVLHIQVARQRAEHEALKLEHESLKSGHTANINELTANHEAQLTEVKTEHASAMMHIDELQESNESLTSQLRVLQGTDLGSLRTVVECENIEATLKHTLMAIDKQKVQINLNNVCMYGDRTLMILTIDVILYY